MTKSWRRSCDLCKIAAASVHCDSDAAFLCFDCDAHVHEANFLVARHLRKTICAACHQIDSRSSFSGVRFPPFHCTICSECHRHHHYPDCASDGSSSSSSSSSCISSADNTDLEIQRSRRRRRKTRRTEISGVPSKHVFLTKSSYVDDEGWGESSSSSSTS